MGKEFIVSDMHEKIETCEKYQEKIKKQLKKMYAKLFQPIVDLYILCEEYTGQCIIKNNHLKIKRGFSDTYGSELQIFYDKKKIIELWLDENNYYRSHYKYHEEYDWAIQEAIFLMEQKLKKYINKTEKETDHKIAEYELNKDKSFQVKNRISETSLW